MCKPKELYSLSPFKELPPKQRGALSSSFQFHHFSQKTTLVNQGKKIFFVGIIVQGTAEITVKVSEEEHLSVYTLGEGEFFGDLFFPGDDIAIASVITKGPLMCYLQPIKDYYLMLKDDNGLGDYLRNSAMKKWNHLFKKLNGSAYLFENQLYRNQEIKPDKIEKSLFYINHNYTKKITLDQVAKEIGMSKYHFSRTFKIKTGFSFKEYINKKRVEKAKELMMKEDMNISEICYLTGYNDVSYFCRIFRQYENKTPTEYRLQAE